MKKHTTIFCLLLAVLVEKIDCGINDNTVEECDLPVELIEEIRSYKPVVEKIITATINGKYKGATYRELAKFVDKFGPRLCGTQNLEDSIDYMLDLLDKNDLENVHGEVVPVPHWERGTEFGQMLTPRKARIPIISLGSSIGTPESGLEAEVIVVRTFEELNQQNFSEAAKGKIVVYNQDWIRYGSSVQYRSHGAAEAAKHGAVAALVSSVTPFSMASLHAGQQDYEEGVTQIPAACIIPEHAHMFQRLQDNGEKIVVRLNITTKNYPATTSRNTVAEVQGSTLPNKVVMVSGHLDSWDVGVGAMDDGGGAFISWYSLVVLKGLGLRPKRTVRAVLWTGEEPGLWGVIGYNETHKNELDDFTFVMESDEGTFTPLGLEYATGPKGGCIIQEIMKLLEPINATQTQSSDAVGSDITIWAGKIPTASLLNANERYFWFHHSAGDTMDVLDPDTLDKATAVWASVAYVIADLSREFPRDFEGKDGKRKDDLEKLRRKVFGNV